MDENQKIVYDLLKEVREDQKKDSKKIHKTEACVSNMQNEISEVKRETKLNTKNLADHMARTEIAEQGLAILKDLHSDNQKRIELLENSSKKKDEALQKQGEQLLQLQTKAEVEKEVKHWFKDNFKYWLTIAGLTVGLVSKILGLW